MLVNLKWVLVPTLRIFAQAHNADDTPLNSETLRMPLAGARISATHPVMGSPASRVGRGDPISPTLCHRLAEVDLSRRVGSTDWMDS